MTPKKHSRSRTDSAGFLGVDPELPTPLYHQIYVVLLDKIVSGTYGMGSRIPSEHEIEKSFGVSRITARRALAQLAAEGLVVRRRGHGTTVVSRPPLSSVTGNTIGLMENLLAMALETDVELLEFSYVRAKQSVAKTLGIRIDDIVQRAVRIRRKNKQAFSYAVTHIPEDIGRKYGQKDIKKHPMLTLIEGAGHKISHATQSLSATLADSTIGPALGINVGSALLKVSRVVFDVDDRPVEHIVVHYRPDLYQLNLNLSRVEAEGVNKWAIAE
ncbi:MAG TPA: GntR family transcriptional regulator [Woeseiaceae bacterium]|nr:GntR family transcriptional regulator [Woeseiaceae bacterium]